MLNCANRTIFQGDNLAVLRGLNTASVDLVYLDPPFKSNRQYMGKWRTTERHCSFKDRWNQDDLDPDHVRVLRHHVPDLMSLIDLLNKTYGDGLCAYLVMLAIRLLELRRVLKPSGSIYVHCPHTISHYLKLFCDWIFGKKKFCNEIIWRRCSSHNDSKVFGRVSDSILFYGNNINTDDVRIPLDPNYVKRAYHYKDWRGRYATYRLSTISLLGQMYHYPFKGHPGPWIVTERRMRELEHDDRLHYPKNPKSAPAEKGYLHENKGAIPANIWMDIAPAVIPERTGYPTQKPVKLLERIIKASSKEGDVVLDPFSGSGTTLVVAERYNRRWVGVELSKDALAVIATRLEKEQNLVKTFRINLCIDPPRRTDG